MTPLVSMLLYTSAAGSCILFGALAARIETLGPRWLEREILLSVIAFGGGVLLSAVSLVLVPEGSKLVPSAISATLLFLLGGLTFFLLERFMGLQGTEKPQFGALLLDYVPESMALGGLFAAGAPSAPLLAVLIGLQNLPEGFNTYREFRAASMSSPLRILVVMTSLIPMGPLLGTLGWFYMDENSAILGAVMLFSSGGIVYLLFQDIAPASKVRRHWAPALGAVVGFALGLFGDLLISH